MKPPDPIPTNMKVDFLMEALSRLTQTASSVQSTATAALTERVQSCPWMRTLGSTTPAETANNRRFIVQPVSQPRDNRPIDQRCIPVLEFCMCVRALHPSQIHTLGAAFAKMGAELDEDNDNGLKSHVYESLAMVSGLLDALRLGVGDEVACVLGGVAAAYSDGTGTSPEVSKRVFNSVTRRVRNAGRLLSVARRDRAAWMVLFDPHADLDERIASHTDHRSEERMRTTAVVALGANVPILPDNCPQRVLENPNCPHIRFQRSMEMLTNSKGSWSLSDALIPCNAVPIRTNHYVAYVNAVSEYACKLVTSLAVSSDDQSFDTLESRCAWALVAFSNPTIQTDQVFAAVLESWCNARAHQPPEKGTSCWLTARALLSRPEMDVGKLSQAVRSLVASWTASSGERDDMFGRIACFCVATRTDNGIRLLCDDSHVANGLLHRTASTDRAPCATDCLSLSPSGVLEFGDYEPGFSEWGAGDATLSRRVAQTFEQQISESLRTRRTTQLTNAVLRLSLLPDNLLTKPWKSAIESFQPELERSMRCETGGAFLCGSETDDVDCLREGAIRAVVFRRRCIRALSDASRYPLRPGTEGRRNAALVTWLCNEAGRCTVFARTFASDDTASAQSIVVEYERLLRAAVGRARGSGDEDDANTHHIVQRSTRVTTIGIPNSAFLDAASRDAVSGPGTRRLECCSGNAVLSASSCAVSVVHWPLVTSRAA